MLFQGPSRFLSRTHFYNLRSAVVPGMLVRAGTVWAHMWGWGGTGQQDRVPGHPGEELALPSSPLSLLSGLRLGLP